LLTVTGACAENNSISMFPRLVRITALYGAAGSIVTGGTLEY
jgi:hypothetical protein